ncbi:hypothetical protein P9112_006574 [Eukaryota sp. TZLM1-RC]
MKDALSIINRLVHDTSLSKERFFVGFEDRFGGVFFLPLHDFLALSVPSHRIRYISKGNSILWSRTKRINLIGSVAPSVSLFSSPTPGVLSRYFPPHATGRKNFQLPFFSNIVSCSVGVHHTLALTACGNCYGFGLNKSTNYICTTFANIHYIHLVPLSVSHML